MLISHDLMQHLARYVEPPAELCLIRVLGSDHEYVFRVRCEDAHLDYPLTVPLLDDANQVAKVCNWDEVAKALAAMSKLVVSPKAHAEWQLNHYAHYSPTILAPMQRYMSPYE